MDRRVTRTGKNWQGDITSLCGSFGSVDKATAIGDIENSVHRYYVYEEAPEVDVKVVTEGLSKYLRTTADRRSRNNLDNLPDC
jgi:hypothetical protein